MLTIFETDIDKAVEELKAEAGIYWLPNEDLEIRARAFIAAIVGEIRANLEKIPDHKTGKIDFSDEIRNAIITDFCRALFGCEVASSYEQIEAAVDRLLEIPAGRLLKYAPHTFLYAIHKHYQYIITSLRNYEICAQKAQRVREAKTADELKITAEYKNDIRQYFADITATKAAGALFALYRNKVNAALFLPIMRASDIERFFNEGETAMHEYRYLLYYATCKYTLLATPDELQGISTTDKVKFIFDEYSGRAHDIAENFADDIARNINKVVNEYNQLQAEKKARQADEHQGEPTEATAPADEHQGEPNTEQPAEHIEPTEPADDITEQITRRLIMRLRPAIIDIGKHDKGATKQSGLQRLKAINPETLPSILSFVENEAGITSGTFSSVLIGFSNLLNSNARNYEHGFYQYYSTNYSIFTELCGLQKNAERVDEIRQGLALINLLSFVCPYKTTITKNGKSREVRKIVPIHFDIRPSIDVNAGKDGIDIGFDKMIFNSNPIIVETIVFNKCVKLAKTKALKRCFFHLLAETQIKFETLLNDCFDYDVKLRDYERKLDKEIEPKIKKQLVNAERRRILSNKKRDTEIILNFIEDCATAGLIDERPRWGINKSGVLYWHKKNESTKSGGNENEKKIELTQSAE